MYVVGDATFDAASKTTNFSFSIGGFQGSRGENSGEDTYIENVFEELDAPSECESAVRRAPARANAPAPAPPCKLSAAAHAHS